MNISATHLPVSQIITPSNVGGVTSPKLSTSSSIDIVTQPVISTTSDTTSHSISDNTNPTYDKPVQSNISSPDPDSQQVIVNKGNVSPSEVSEPVPEDSADKSVDTNTQSQNEIYSEAELAQISDLKIRDTEVNAHERAHAAVGGQHAGSPSYSYKTGPDGIKYAVSGEVSIDTSRVPGDPQATLQKAQQIKAAALAPAEPSGQDRKVAAKADQMATQARNDILESTREGDSNVSSSASKYTESSVPEHFTGQQNLSINNNSINYSKIDDSASQSKMNERSFHINEFYENSSSVNSLSKLEITA